MTDQKIVPNIWCNGNAEEVVAFYRSTFPDAVESYRSHYPREGLLDFQAAMAGEVLMIEFAIRGHRMMAINAGPEFTPNPMLSFMVNFDPTFDENAAQRLDEVWARLAEGGKVLMELGSYPFSEHYGWVQDRFGVSWQLILTNPAGEPRPFVIPSLMFANAHVNQAEEAMTFYTSLFDDARIGTVARWPEQTGAAAAGSVMFGEFAVGDEWFTAMDSPAPHDFDYNEGLSLLIECEDQAEIDRLWEQLSTVPEAEACGWCKDRFGVSWQVAPKGMDAELTAEDYAAMMTMKKIVIADLPSKA